MRIILRHLFILIFGVLCSSVLLAQPILSYSPASNTYTAGTAISTLNITNTGQSVSAFSYGTRTALSGTTFSGPAGIGMDASGNIYITNFGNNTIRKYSSSGTFLSTFISSSTLNGPDGIVFDSSGNCYVLSYSGGKVLKYNSSGVLQSTIVTGLNNPAGIAIDASDNLYIGDTDNDIVRKYSTSGTALATITSNVSAPTGIAINSTGDVFVLNYGTDKVTKYNSSLTYQSGFTSITGLNNSWALTIDGADNLYIGSSGENKVKIYSQSGTLLTTISSITDGEGVAVDAVGNLYVSDYTDDKVYKYPPAGGYFINAELPAGLSFNSSTGAITGTPTTPTPATTYTVYGYRTTTSFDNATVTITVKPATPTAPSGGGAGCSLTLTASGSTPAGGTYTWYNVSTGGTALATGTTYVASPGTYYVSYTYNTVESSRSTGTTVTTGVSPILATAPTGSGLYLSYPFNGNANDASSAGNNGTVQGAASLTTDRYSAANKAYSFNGSSQYISTATQVASPGPQNFSISVWFKTSTAGGKLVGFGATQSGGVSSTYDRHIYMTNAGQIYYGIYPGSVQTIGTAGSYADGNWHHAVATTSTTAGSFLFIDGAVVAADAAMTTSQTYAGYWRVGYDNVDGWTNAPSNRYFTGSLDDVAVYNTAISASQVYTLYGAGSPPTCVGSSLLLQANSVAGATYSWSGPGGFTSSSQNPTVTTSATTAHAGTYTLTVTSATGCVTTTTVTAVVNTLPVATFTATSPVTVGANSTITYTGTYASTSTYAWGFNGGTIVSGSGVGPYTVNWSTTGTKTITLTVTNAAGCSDASTQTVTVTAANYGNYGFKKPITLNTTTLGITSNLTNFPALLSIQDNNLIISGTCTDKVYSPNGPNYDFAFTDAAGSTEYKYQVESYDQTTGTLLVWVQIPTLTYASNMGIYMFYGSPSPTITHNTAFYQSTWGSDYQAVFHFNESLYTGSVTDGTAGGHTAATGGMSSSDLVTGKIGTGYSFNGSSKKITSNAVNITGSFTISAWVKPATVTADQKILTNQASAGSSTGGYKLGIYSNGIPETESATAIDRGTATQPSALTANTWYYIQGVFNGSTLSTYINGVQYATLSTTTAPTSTTPFYIGVGEGGGAYYFSGIIDETRVSNTAKSTDWLKAEYVNQNSPTAFTSPGTTTVVSTYAAAVPGALTYTWKGVTTDPASASNWDNTTAGTTNQLPDFSAGTATLVIPTGLSNYPSLTANASLYGLTIASGASFNLNGWTLNVGCNIYNSSGGQILYGTNNASSINWNGSLANQTYTGTNTSATASLGAMTINNTAGGTVTISSGPVDIYKSLTITQGNLAVGASPAALTLKSTATQTAYVAAIPSGSSITGTVKVERYVTGGAGYRGYRLISSPVYAATVSSNVYDVNYLISGMYLTGTTGTGGGFDKTGNPSLYLYREDQVPNNSGFTTGNFWGISKINNSPAYNYYMNGGSTTYNIPSGGGVMVFFRGNRASATLATETSPTYTTPVTVTLTAAGTLNQGQVVVRDWYTPTSTTIGYTGTGAGTNSAARGYNLVGNPYASAIDWENFNTSSSTTGIYGVNIGTTIWERKANGGYAQYQKGGASTNGGISNIGSGQGFFVRASGTNPQLIFNESAKTSAQNTSGIYFESTRDNLATIGKTETGQRSFMRLQLLADSVNNEDIYIGFDKQASRSYVFDEDAAYLGGSIPVGLSSLSADNIALGINKIQLPQRADTIRLNSKIPTPGRYYFNMTEFKNVPDLYEVWLMDAYKKDSLDIKHNPSYAFDSFNGDTSSFSLRRFSLVIRQNPALALHLLNFTAAKTATGAEMTWTTENEAGYTNFTIERSSDNGKTFQVVGGYASGNEGTYSLLDRNPPVATDLYRLKMEDLNGVISYSKTIALVYTGQNNLALAPVSVYPNPAKNTINVSIVPSIKQIPAPSNVSFNIIITGSNGTVVQKAASSQTEWQGTVANLLPGSYVVQVVNSQDKSVVGKSKFVKL